MGHFWAVKQKDIFWFHFQNQGEGGGKLEKIKYNFRNLIFLLKNGTANFRTVPHMKIDSFVKLPTEKVW